MTRVIRIMGRHLIDIGCNLTDPVFRGVYNARPKHDDDLTDVLDRARDQGVRTIVVTGTNVSESQQAIELAKNKDLPVNLMTTVGCHPTRCLEFGESGDEEDRYLNELRSLVANESVVAIGEIGLDYDRVMFCPIGVQKKRFELQLRLSEESGKPLFLHCRSAAQDLADILTRHPKAVACGGVVHSFTGSWDEAQSFLNLGLHIGINGCSLKTEDNLSVLEKLPVDHMLLETDAPWCEVKPTHASFKFVETKFESKKKERFERGKQVKGRNEPCNLIHVVEVVSAVKKIPIDDLIETVRQTTESLFHIKCPE